MDMAELATANHIRGGAVLGDAGIRLPWPPGLQPAPKIDILNAWIRGYAMAKGHVYVDYHSALKGAAEDGLPKNLSHD